LFSGSEYLAMLSRLYECPLRVLRWCVLSYYEKEKCRLMKNAFARKNIKPDIDCVSAKNTMECMSKIRQGIADIITVDPADAYRGQRYYQLVPLAAEDYGVDMESNVMYAVAVAKRTDLTTNLWNLRGKTICSSALGDLAGWHVPVDYLTAIKELFITHCQTNKAAG
jgi:melanoma-associated antigen p97